MKYNILKKNGYLKTDEETEKLLENKEFSLFCKHDKDENFVIYTPYLPMYVTNFKIS